MIIINPPFGLMKNKRGSDVALVGRHGVQVMRINKKPSNPRTAAQVIARSNFSSASTAFVALSSSSKAAWQNFSINAKEDSGRASFIARFKQILTCNQFIGTAGTGFTPGSQTIYTPGTELAMPSANAKDFMCVDSTNKKFTPSFNLTSFTVATGAIAFTLNTGAAGATFTGLKNSGGKDLIVYIELLVQKGKSKYKRSYLAITKMAAASSGVFTVSGALSGVPATNYKYSVAAGANVTANCYFLDPNSSFSMQLIGTSTVVAA